MDFDDFCVIARVPCYDPRPGHGVAAGAPEPLPAMFAALVLAAEADGWASTDIQFPARPYGEDQGVVLVKGDDVITLSIMATDDVWGADIESYTQEEIRDCDLAEYAGVAVADSIVRALQKEQK